MILTRISINNPVFATMMMVALMVLGLFAYQRLGVDQFPNIDFPLVVVSTTYPGAAPETVESDVTRKIEEAVNTISGVKTVTSTSIVSLTREARSSRSTVRLAPNRGSRRSFSSLTTSAVCPRSALTSIPAVTWAMSSPHRRRKPGPASTR